MLPVGQKARVRDSVDRLDLMPQSRQGHAAEPAQHLGVAPLCAVRVRPELAVDDTPIVSEAAQCVVSDRGAEPEPVGHIRGRERAMGSRVPAHEVAERVVDRFDECD
ncbi:MAG TPA: hypothetical protein VGN29_20335, partial [Solirubrobacteraceae bacterium]|nr:hypothetical protein [Solirubrobacteraceae bacterium]